MTKLGKGTLIGVLLSIAFVAEAHEAPSGWTYPISCCSNKDCQEVSSATVKETSTGYVVTLRAEEHIMLLTAAQYYVPYGDSRIKDAPDGVYHVCISQQSQYSGNTYGGDLLCLFVPPKGF